MTLEVRLYHRDDCLYTAKIANNLAKMAKECYLYNPLWHPDKIGAKVGGDLIGYLLMGIVTLIADEFYFIENYSPSNGRESYEDLLTFAKNYLDACKRFPDAYISVSR